ncbi:hypothetical protein [Gabonibacter massiliensis]|uniref:hypothetical protein n=1 Tax=Gabonibacter massiliensis TaxID=1720195 RepID=UPI00073F591B|nr:hypothetical protein [Gabonibacter massiliensis]
MQRLIWIILILSVSLSVGAKPFQKAIYEGEEEISIVSEDCQTSFSLPVTVDKLMNVYDWIGNSFVLTPTVDLPAESEFQKGKRSDPFARSNRQTMIALLICTDSYRKIGGYLFERHIQGFYIYMLSKMII